jgi:hypothetical protein
MRTPRVAVCCLVMMAWAASSLWARSDFNHWDVPLHVQSAILTDSLAVFGVRSDATADFDNAYDIPRPPRAPSGDYLELYFPHTGGAYPPLLGSKYAADYQGPINPEWTMAVESSVTGPVTITWDSTLTGTLDPAIHLYLEDLATGTVTDMRHAGSYTFNWQVRRNFLIRGSLAVGLTYLMEGFWNGTTQVGDSVTGYLADKTSPHGLIDSAGVRLSTSGTGTLLFSRAIAGGYYLVVRHRNHLTLWSTDTLALMRGTTGVTPFDFSAAGAAYGTSPTKHLGSVYVAIGGDVNQDGVVDYRDRNLTWNDRGRSGGLNTDCNGDGITNTSDDAITLGNRYAVVQQPR